MNENLRAQYLEYLANHDLAPRELPPEWLALQEATLERLKTLSKQAGDPNVADMLDEVYQKNAGIYRAETRGPATVLIERTAAEVETSIHAIDRYRASLTADVFAGEFPTGSINAQAVQADGGYLVLVNSGLLVVLQQIAELLVDGDRNHPTDRAANQKTLDGVVAVLEAYLRYGDPLLGPKPMGGGITIFLRYALSHAAQAFVIAHEYGHVIAGHFNNRALKIEQLTTAAGPIHVIKKEWSQELEADLIAHKILLGVDDYAKLQVGVIDQALEEDEFRGAILAEALRLKAALAAPFIFLTIASLLDDVVATAKGASSTVQSDSTHPPARERMDNLMSCVHDLTPKHSDFINFAGILWAHYDEILERLVRSFLGSPAGGAAV